ncbi:MAG: hypothetical protein RSF40_08870 [Oscillospiraceae bacterium]
MIFLWDFVSDETSFNPVATDISNIKSVKISNGIYDDLYLTKNTKYEYSNVIPTTWTFDTILHALFNGNLKAGNVDFSASEVDSLRIKRRVKNTFDWLLLCEISVRSKQDFEITGYDKLACSETDYEYCIIPVINGVEGNLSITSVHSQFDGIYLIDRDEMVGSVLNVEQAIQRNRPTAVKNALGRRYSTVISNSNNNYDSGSVSATFIEEDTLNGMWKTDEGVSYRKWVMDFLCNGKPKVLKDFQGRMWLCQIVGNPSEDSSQHYQMPITRFEWSETGDCSSSIDLYNNGLIDINQSVMGV